MPSPSKFALFSGLAVTTGLFLGGAWLASGMTPPTATSIEPTDAPKRSPLLAPVPSVDIQSNTQSKALKVTVSGVRNSDGKVIVLVFDSAAAYDAYDYERAVGYAELTASSRHVSHVFSDLSDGPFAVVAIHDENENYDLDLVDGYPSEGYGTSRATSPYDELSFQQAAVAAGAVELKIHYLD